MITAEEQAVFEELKQGSDVAFKKVYEANRELFLNFTRKYGLSTNEALDVYQDTYISFYENIENGKLVVLKSTISTYLISIGKYKMMNILRSNQRKYKREAPLEVVGDVSDETASFDLEGEVLNDEEQLLKRYFEQLGDKCKSIITWFYYQKYSIKKIMELGDYNSENVVKSQKSRCMKTLRELCLNTPK